MAHTELTTVVSYGTGTQGDFVSTHHPSCMVCWLILADEWERTINKGNFIIWGFLGLQLKDP
jgi:hypothetical protein